MNKRRLQKAVVRLLNLPRNKYLLYYILNKIKHIGYKVSKTTKVAHPSTIMIELTNHCNLHCTTCPREYDYGKSMDKGTMKVEQATAIIDEVWPYLDSIGLTGMGETFLYNDLALIVDYIKAKNKGIIVSVSTNAMLPNFIEKVTPLINKIDTIQISIDGLEEVYNSIRKQADFNMLHKHLRLLSDMCRVSSTTLMLNMVVTKENYFQMPSLVEYASDSGIGFIEFTLFNLASVTDIEQSYYNFYKSGEFLNIVKELNHTIQRFPNVSVLNKNFDTLNGFRKCPFPWSHFYICWNGYVTPCCAKPFPKELHFGNVFTDGVMGVLNSKSFRNWRKLWFRNITPAFCEKCHFIDIEPVK
ncbi:MAG: SPASM domain-containing protein [Bacteroidales bacterium]|nr:SPASM domain-containing protein [Bacteroidales bacterium]